MGKPGKKVNVGGNDTTKKTSLMFYRDLDHPTCTVPDHKDVKEFRLNYRMPWTKVNKLVRLFILKNWVMTQDECDERMVVGLKVCPPKIEILGTHSVPVGRGIKLSFHL